MTEQLQFTSLVFLPGELHGQRSLAGHNPWDHKESDMPERHTHTQVLFEMASDHFEMHWKKSLISIIRYLSLTC